MGTMIQLRASDGHELAAYQATPRGEPKAGLVILQEVFGVTDHIKRVADGFALDGYLAVAPSLFDRVTPGMTLPYSNVEAGRDIMLGLDMDQCVLDMQAAVEAASAAGPVAAIGYCWGGAMADLAACKLDLKAAVVYYGGRITSWLDLKPNCPVLYHFGGRDPLILPETVAEIRGSRPAGIFHIYPAAGHGFNCDEREDYEPASAKLARERTMEFLKDVL